MKKLVFLNTDQDFTQFRQSKSVSSKNLRLRLRYNTNQNTPRFGFIIPKKILAKVTDRNKVKRRLKSLLLKHVLSIRPADYLFFPQKSALKTSFNDLDQEFVELFVKARLWKR